MSQLFGWEGALALGSEESSGLYVSPQFPTFLGDSARLDRYYLGWLLRRKVLWEELGSRTKGMGDRRRTLNPEALLSCTIPLPPLADERRIVAYFDGLQANVDELRRLQAETQKELDALMPSILSKAFAGEL